MQARSLPLTQDAIGERQPLRVDTAPFGYRPGFVDACLRDPILGHHTPVLLKPRHPGVHSRQWWSWWNMTEMTLDGLPGCFDVNITGQHERRVVRTVVGPEPLVNVFQGSGVQVFHGADSGPGIGMPFGKHVSYDVVEGSPVRLIFALALLVLDHTALLIELVLIDRAEEMTHAVRLHPHCKVQRGRRHCLKVVGAVRVGRAIHAGRADLLERGEILAVIVLAAIEHQVFEKMGEASLARNLISGTHVVPECDRHDRSLSILVYDDPEPVIQVELLEQNVELCVLRECNAR